MWVAGKTCVIPLTRAVLSALEMSLIIKHDTDLRQYIFLLQCPFLEESHGGLDGGKDETDG